MIIVLDVNETLLDLKKLDPLFERYFGSGKMRHKWFDQVLKSAFVSNVVGPYRDFGMVARAALQMVAERRGVVLEDAAIHLILGQMRRLDPHPDVLEGIAMLKRAGFRLAALTNSPPNTARAQLEYAGIAPFLEHILSVDASQALKPMRIVYDDALKTLGAKPAETCLVAAHAWDIAGAMQAGLQGAFIRREGKVWNPLFENPTFTGVDIIDVARQISNLKRSI